MVALGDHSLGLAIALRAAVGLILGSFTATCAMRLAERRPWAAGRSACDACGVTLSYAATTPLLGYALSGGRCRHCGGAIDPLHPIAELIGAVVIGTTAPMDGRVAVLQAVMGLGLLFVAVFDLKTRRIPNLAVAILAITAAAVAALEDRLWSSLGAAVAAWVFLAGARALFRRLRGRDGFGGGDVKLIAALALWLGADATPWMLLGATGLAAIWARASRVRADQSLAFAPFLALSAWATAFVLMVAS
jgi:leader peptidase (prepilin peptidase)/N-methyltransferase